MNLHEWCRLSDTGPTHPATERGTVAVRADRHSPHRQLLWRLSDFVVSSDCGSVVWLVPTLRDTAHPRSPEEHAQWQLWRTRQQVDRLEQAVSAGQFDQYGLISLATASAALQEAASRLHATAVSARRVASEPHNQVATVSRYQPQPTQRPFHAFQGTLAQSLSQLPETDPCPSQQAPNVGPDMEDVQTLVIAVGHPLDASCGLKGARTFIEGARPHFHL
jgi:hypothetical protein